MDKDGQKIRKKIILTITKSNFGGAQRYVHDLAISLPKELFEVIVICGGEGILKEKLQKKNIRTISLPNLQRDINIIKELWSLMEFFMIFWRERPDIVHGNSSKSGGITSFIARILGVKKIIFTAHAWAFNYDDRNSFSNILISFFHWLSIMLSHRTIAVSRSVKDQVANFPFIKDKIVVVNLGIDPPEFIPRSEARTLLMIPENSYCIGTIAELHPVKGLRYSLEAISLLRSESPMLFEKIQYSILGEGKEKMSLDKEIILKKLETRVFLKGWINNAASYLQAFDLFVLPSLSEAFGYVLLEAGFAKVPIIASNVGGIGEIIKEGETGRLFESKNSVAIKSTIEEAIGNAVETEKKAEKLYKEVRKNFTLEKMVGRTIEIYG